MTLEELIKVKAKQKNLLDLYSKYSDTGKIGIKVPISVYTLVDNEHCLLLKFKPPRIPVKSKKIYKGVFVRSMKPFKALYDIETKIYIVSLQNDADVHMWIDNNLNKIKERICLMTDFQKEKEES